MMSARREQFLALAVLAAFAAASWSFSYRVPSANALVSGSPCSGNICTGTLTIGGQLLSYSYTQHVRPNGEFRIRVNGGVYETNGLISYVVSFDPAFASWDKLANPNGSVYLPNEQVNPGLTAYERYDNDGCSGCKVDQVMSITFSGLTNDTVHNFDLAVAQYGESAVRRDLQFYVDAGAPSNQNESNSWGALAGMDFPCADGRDNDLDYGPDCADGQPSGPYQCAGSVGEVGSEAVCQTPETTCNDEFDNDADLRPDCLDQDCDGRVGEPGGSALCQYGNEFGIPSCGDTFDNDADGLSDCVDNLFNAAAGGTAETVCWKKPVHGCPAVEACSTFQDDDKDKSFDDSWDNNGLTGVNCQDYDCFGDPACPARENKTAAGADADDQCFNLAGSVPIDDDLDHQANCADPDCIGVVNPGNTAQICYDKEFSLVDNYQLCSNAFDDDGDGPQDCADTDCKRQFGNCGPCPAREDFTFDACADGSDNDADVGFDCADVDCDGDLGRLVHASRCAASENASGLCGDRFDNDGDGAIDCADPQCVGSLGPRNQTCELVESSCGDTFDNDGDGRRDCADADCAGAGSCALKSWTNATCQVVPRSTNPTPFASNDPTVTASVRVAAHVSATDEIRFVGTGTYSSITIIVGDNTDADGYYPYAAAGCTLIDNVTELPPTGISFVAIPGHAVQIFDSAAGNVAGFDVTFSCATPALLEPVPADNVHTYPIAILMQREPGGIAESGEEEFTITLYEATPPTVAETEPEGAAPDGTINIPYSGIILTPARRFRGVPNDPGAPPESSGICRCVVNFSGVDHAAGPDCVTAPVEFTEDEVISVSARAEDGAGNLGGFNLPQSFTVNVVPTPSVALAVDPERPFFRDGDMEAGVTAEFLTGLTDFFSPVCNLYMRDAFGTPVGGGPITFAPIGLLGNWIRCEANPVLPTPPGDGTYYLTIRVTDNDGNAAESNRRVAYVCNDIPGPGPDPGNGCIYADFDNDGAAEGLYTDKYSTSFKACDNCVGLPNVNQEDVNANGIGDLCEPRGSDYGRCEIDTQIVCSYDSDDIAHDCPPGLLCCPGPSLGIDYSDGPPDEPKNPQLCIAEWGICTLGGEICFVDDDCPGGPGICVADGSSCWLDQNCFDRGLDPPTCTGADRCEQLLHPWLQTVHGNVFSKKKISAPEPPPQSQFNATFCIVAKESILNFESSLCEPPFEGTDAAVRYERPRGGVGGNNYSSVLGRIDVAGLRAGKYGEVISVDVSADPRQLDTVLSFYADRLGGRVFRVTGGEAIVGAHTIYNDAKGSGTIFGDGVNIRIDGDIAYENATVADLKRLASLGWIVIDDGSNTKGNIYIKGTVTNVVGAFFAGGDDGIRTVYPEEIDSPAPLTVHGLMLARKFVLSRSYKDLEQGSERVIYDGRAVVNPPPGFGDVSKSLPLFSDALPQ